MSDGLYLRFEVNVELRVRDLDSVRHRSIHETFPQGPFERTALLGLEKQADSCMPHGSANRSCGGEEEVLL